MSAIALYAAFVVLIWLELIIEHFGSKSRVHWLTAALIGLGWPIWVFGACKVIYLQVDILTKEEESK